MTAEVAHDTAWLPHDMTADTVMLVRTSPERLAEAAFLDGRERFWTNTAEMPIAEYLEAMRQLPEMPLRLILHVSFCGSTLLSRFLENSGRSVIYREPAIHVALADRMAAGGSVADICDASDRAFARRIDDAVAIVKPTSWANALLPLWTTVPGFNPIFITMEPRSFLRAAFRGGRERLAFVLRLAQHLAAARRTSAWLLKSATIPSSQPLLPAARLTLAALHLQTSLMREARKARSLSRDVVLDAADIFRDAREAAHRASHTLSLEIGSDSARTGCWSDANAKDPKAPFSRAEEDAANAQIESFHGPLFDAALIWADQQGLAFSV